MKHHFLYDHIPMCEEQKKVIQKEMDRLEHLGIIKKTDWLQLTGCLNQMEKPKFVSSWQ